MTLTMTETVYVFAGILLPAYYLPQMAKCAADKTRLAAYSMSKASSQLALRMAMLPFVFGIGNLTMTCVVALDFAGRASEFAIAVWSLSRQGVKPREILSRCLPFGRLRNAEAAGAVPNVPSVANWSAMQPASAGAHQGGFLDPDRDSSGAENQHYAPDSRDIPSEPCCAKPDADGVCSRACSMSAGVTSSTVWLHAYGQMRAETFEDGSVLVDTQSVRDTVPGTDRVLPEASVLVAEQPHGEHSQATADPEEVPVEEQLTAEAKLSTRVLAQVPRPHDTQAEIM